MDRRERLIRRVARAVLWSSVAVYQRDNARQIAIGVVDDLLAAPAEGKAAERFLRLIEDERQEQAG